VQLTPSAVILLSSGPEQNTKYFKNSLYLANLNASNFNQHESSYEFTKYVELKSAIFFQLYKHYVTVKISKSVNFTCESY